MKTVSLSGSARQGVGKKDAAALRRDGRVPAVLYGGDQQIHFNVSAIELKKLIYSPDVYEVNLDIDGTSYRSIIKGDEEPEPRTETMLTLSMLNPNEVLMSKISGAQSIDDYQLIQSKTFFESTQDLHSNWHEKETPKPEESLQLSHSNSIFSKYFNNH